MVRYGVIGFGLHAVRRLMPGFALATKSRVQALSRRDIDKARESARHYDIPLAFDSAEELCKSPDVDAVFVATPNSLHLEDVLTAIRCRKPVLCEKPMAMNADQCRHMIEASRKANVRLGIAHVFRFEDSTARLRERVASGQIGNPIFARSEFSFPAGGGHPRTWLNDASIAGGGPVADIGVHCIDTLRYVLQDDVVRVAARGARDDKSGTVESAAVLALEFARGTLGSVMVSFQADYRTPFEIVGDAGVLRADDALNVERPITIQLRRGVEIVEQETVTNYQAYARQVDAFADAIEGKGEFAVPGEEGWQNQLILDAAYRSMATGKLEEVIKVK